jgi:hypothetical protein
VLLRYRRPYLRNVTVKHCFIRVKVVAGDQSTSSPTVDAVKGREGKGGIGWGGDGKKEQG